MKRKVGLLLLLAAIILLAACGNADSPIAGVGETKKDVSIEEIQWQVEESILDGERYVMLSYCNNSEYAITEFELQFNQKKNLTQESVDQFYLDLKEKYDLDDSTYEGLKTEEISMHVESERLVAPGENVKNEHCYYFGGYIYVRNFDHYQLVEPDIVTFKYVKDDKIHTCYYDFRSKKYFVEEKVEAAYYWTTSTLGQLISKPDFMVVKNDGRDDDKLFSFEAFGVSLDEFNNYVNDCKAKGFIVDSRSHSGFYSADDANGYNVYLSYNEESCSFRGSIESPDN